MYRKLIFTLFFTIVFIGCSTTKHRISQSVDEVHWTILQFNDFYEIGGLDGGTIGGAARMATLRKKLKAENPNLLTVVAGDFLSPSLLGTLKKDGEGVKGRQIIEAFNAIGVDLVTFGNHEFDYDQKTLQKRINESKFDWVSTNVLENKEGALAPFAKEKDGQRIPIPLHHIVRFTNSTGAAVRLGFVAPCIDANKAKFVFYDSLYPSVKRELAKLKNEADVFLSLSHLNKSTDLQMARDFNELSLIMGGHEHDHMKYEVGHTVLTKADANARTAYVHRMTYNVKTHQLLLKSELVPLDKTIAEDGQLLQLIKSWKEFENQYLKNAGFDPDQKIPGSEVNYDARELTIRNKPAAFPEMICKSMLAQCPQCDAAIMNSGSIRLDDELHGYISQYDILRALPYAGSIISLDMKGDLLEKTLNVGIGNKGMGGFLQWANIRHADNGSWMIGSSLLKPDKIYHIILNEYLLTGLERNLDFLNKNNPGISNIITAENPAAGPLRKDIRLAIIDYLKKGGR